MVWKLKNQNNPVSKEVVNGFNPIILQILFNRGIKTKEEIESFFNFNYEKNISDPFAFSGMAEAVERIGKAMLQKEKVAIFGDYDADGVTATAVIFETLKFLNFEQVISYIPDRQTEGYGMNMESLDFLQKEGVSLIITVDCGITNYQEVLHAKELGMEVIITDHHHIPSKLPEAVAVINPNLEKNNLAAKHLAGVGVAFKLAQALFKKYDPEKIDQIKWMLDLVAIGTVADCVPLLRENRVLVKYGLIVLSKTRRAGLLEMFKVGRISISEGDIPDTHKVAFQISPRINAAGRMDHANSAYKLIIEKDQVAGRGLALEIESQNQNRQKMTGEIVKEVKAIAEKDFQDKKFIYAFHEYWPVGLLGLIAGKIADEMKKPVLIMQKKADKLVGSLRSIPQVNIIESLEKCAEFLEKFGGHSQAAGITLKIENLEKFCAKMGEIIEKEVEGKEMELGEEVDMEISFKDIDWELAMDIKKLEPFGEGNPEPVFLAKKLIVENSKIVGNGNKHLKLSLRSEDGGPKIFDSICFGKGEEFGKIKKGDRVDMSFHLCQDEWNGNKKIQLKAIHLEII
jgi:single-stranded-DNA-specific exonuclease